MANGAGVLSQLHIFGGNKNHEYDSPESDEEIQNLVCF